MTFMTYGNNPGQILATVRKLLKFAHNFLLLLNSSVLSHVSRCSVKKVLLKILQNSQENACARVSFRPATLLTKKLWHRYFSCEFCKISTTPFYIEHIRWLLL